MIDQEWIDGLRRRAKNCTTHHRACDCIELKHAEREVKVEEFRKWLMSAGYCYCCDVLDQMLPQEVREG